MFSSLGQTARATGSTATSGAATGATALTRGVNRLTDAGSNLTSRVTSRLSNLRRTETPTARTPETPGSGQSPPVRNPRTDSTPNPRGSTPETPSGIIGNTWGRLGTMGRVVTGGIAATIGGALATDIMGIDFGEMLSGGEDGPGPGDDPTDSANGLNGSLDAPSEVEQGEPFTANYSISRDGIEEAAGRVAIAFDDGEELIEIGHSQFNLGPNRTADEGSFETEQGWSLPAGEYDLHLTVVTDEAEGVVDTDKITVAEVGDATDDGWGDPEVVEELPHGWFLMAQPRIEGPEEVRFLLVGTREDGQEIYIHPDGKARPAGYTYATADKAATAYEQWVERHESGSTREDEIPSEEAGRPNGGAVAQDAQNANSGPTGLLNRVRGYARRNPIQFIGITVLTAAGGYYLYREGHLDKPIRKIQRVNPL